MKIGFGFNIVRQRARGSGHIKARAIAGVWRFGIAAALVVLFTAPFANGASTLLDYEKRVFRAAEQVERIKTDRAYEEEGLAHIRNLVPAVESVSFDGESVSVDNSWLHTLLDKYSGEADTAIRLTLLSEAGGRLHALDEHLREAAAIAHEAVGTDDSREKIEEILSRSEYREKREDRFTAYVKEIRNRILKFISDFFTRLFQIIFGSAGASNVISKFIIIAMISGAAYGVYRLAKQFPRGKKASRKRVVMGEEIEANMTAGELADAALAAASKGDYRTGVRNLYISLLYELAEREIIELEPNTTNHEYLAKVSERTRLAAPMAYLTDRFDYFWYGMFDSTEQDFSLYFERYKEAIAQAQVPSQPAAVATAGQGQ
ncbi:MAG TPA: DUF4129 domain-containing protein [Blastocatellia bacterium]|jgi:hypothetical protein|nr:DUF4129 domain-containing protein [Blastocatellia bacterium]